MAFEHPVTALLKRINQSNPQLPIPLTVQNVLIGSPMLLPAGGEFNTRVTITPNAQYQYTPRFGGEVMVQYNRLVMGELFSGLTVPGRYSQYTSTRDVAQALALRYGVALTREDVTLSSIEDTRNVVLWARNDSLGFWGNVTLPYEVVV